MRKFYLRCPKCQKPRQCRERPDGTCPDCGVPMDKAETAKSRKSREKAAKEREPYAGPPPTCGDCSRPMELAEYDVFHHANGERKKFWRCLAFPFCKGKHSAHPNGEPCGTPGDETTRKARSIAHQHFDQFFFELKYTTKQKYAWLARRFGIPLEDAHIAKFTVEQCERLVEAVKQEQALYRKWLTQAKSRDGRRKIRERWFGLTT